MRERIAFQTRTEVDDGFGNVTSGPFETVFEEPARLKPGLGSETVIAARLAGTQPYTMTIRSSTRTRQITPAWQAVDARNPTRIFDIKAIANPDEWSSNLNLVVVEQ
ncbi:head-tail adaptor protein [Shinella zoogloeoides]|uniref:head-tail adaptor protein n=1 Tax=Shinella zoogloeoides TaxID=352475 RepID=UPI001F596409|nr:head-tail adaptor protein [Shinella zoogloeoides]